MKASLLPNSHDERVHCEWGGVGRQWVLKTWMLCAEVPAVAFEDAAVGGEASLVVVVVAVMLQVWWENS